MEEYLHFTKKVIVAGGIKIVKFNTQDVSVRIGGVSKDVLFEVICKMWHTYRMNSSFQKGLSVFLFKKF